MRSYWVVWHENMRVARRVQAADQLLDEMVQSDRRLFVAATGEADGGQQSWQLIARQSCRDPPPVKWFSAMLSRTDDRDGEQASQA